MTRPGIVVCALLVCSCGPRTVSPDEASLRKALARGGEIRLPPSTIEIVSELPVPAGAVIRGAGPGTILRAAREFRGRAILVVRSARGVRLEDFAIDGRRADLEQRAGLPPSDVPFARFTSNNGILIENAADVDVERVQFREIAGFAVLASASARVRITKISVGDSGSRNGEGRNNTTGGVLFEEGAVDFTVSESEFRGVRGNAVWTHSLYTSPRNARGRIYGNIFDTIARDAVQVGHATEVRVEGNRGARIGYPLEEVDAIPVAIDTAGNTDRSVYARNRFEEINGKCIDLDGFHHGEVRGNVCINRGGPEAYPQGGYAIVMNNSNPDMKPERVVIAENEIDGSKFGGIFVIGSGNRVERNRLRRLNLARCDTCYFSRDEPALPRTGIYLGRGAERPAPARGNIIVGNEVSGYRMAARCVGAAPGVRIRDNTVSGNRCRSE
ncbi:MAG: right-handed parallel beta-helix repeat-containing protein [Gemmatimonadetes bacterium]|nr:right-handed parallel beta-helix repeat-containing protein [Gemmatimonadota bacterium]